MRLREGAVGETRSILRSAPRLSASTFAVLTPASPHGYPLPSTNVERVEDLAVAVERVRIPRQPTDISGLLAVPEVDGTFPGIVVIPTVRGLDEFMERVTERLAGGGFVALAVGIFDHPGVPEDPY